MGCLVVLVSHLNSQRRHKPIRTKTTTKTKTKTHILVLRLNGEGETNDGGWVMGDGEEKKRMWEIDGDGKKTILSISTTKHHNNSNQEYYLVQHQKHTKSTISKNSTTSKHKKKEEERTFFSFLFFVLFVCFWEMKSGKKSVQLAGAFFFRGLVWLFVVGVD